MSTAACPPPPSLQTPSMSQRNPAASHHGPPARSLAGTCSCSGRCARGTSTSACGRLGTSALARGGHQGSGGRRVERPLHAACNLGRRASSRGTGKAPPASGGEPPQPSGASRPDRASSPCRHRRPSAEGASAPSGEAAHPAEGASTSSGEAARRAQGASMPAGVGHPCRRASCGRHAAPSPAAPPAGGGPAAARAPSACPPHTSSVRGMPGRPLWLVAHGPAAAASSSPGVIAEGGRRLPAPGGPEALLAGRDASAQTSGATARRGRACGAGTSHPGTAAAAPARGACLGYPFAMVAHGNLASVNQAPRGGGGAPPPREHTSKAARPAPGCHGWADPIPWSPFRQRRAHRAPLCRDPSGGHPARGSHPFSAGHAHRSSPGSLLLPRSTGRGDRPPAQVSSSRPMRPHGAAALEGSLPCHNRCCGPGRRAPRHRRVRGVWRASPGGEARPYPRLANRSCSCSCGGARPPARGLLGSLRWFPHHRSSSPAHAEGAGPHPRQCARTLPRDPVLLWHPNRLPLRQASPPFRRLRSFGCVLQPQVLSSSSPRLLQLPHPGLAGARSHSHGLLCKIR
mmetsp:Transcript_15525/g.36887  ORF Transcript_15525/g.36887 Transcript_15525/m.36887 type:complete len:572 (+) Transcript_15525:266-1981(+)